MSRPETPWLAHCAEKLGRLWGYYKRHKDRFPGFGEQLNIALRYHCCEGNLKWVSLLLWAGADPEAKGPDSPDETPDPEYDLCALEHAALNRNFDIFKLKKINIAPDHPVANELLINACRAKTADFLIELINQGFTPASREDTGSSLIQSCLQYLPWLSVDDWLYREKRNNIDSSRSRETIKMIHILAKHGARWAPADQHVINEARRALLKMEADYTVEFIWIMSKYNACQLRHIEQLIRTPAIKRLIAGHQSRIDALLKDFSRESGSESAD